MADIPVTEFGIKNIEKAYMEIKSSTPVAGMIGVVTALAVYLMLDKIMKVYRQAQYEDGKVDMKHFVSMIYQYAAFVLVILVLPFLIIAIEKILTEMQTSLVGRLGGEPVGYLTTMLSEFDTMNKRFPDGPTIFTGITDIFAYFNVMFVKPFLAWIVRYMYGGMLAGRYLYLLLLELAAPVAIIMLLNEKTQSHFYTWLKHMMVCYLMIPAFILANSLGDKVVFTIFDDPYAFIAIVGQFVLKLYLFKFASKYVFQLI